MPCNGSDALIARAQDDAETSTRAAVGGTYDERRAYVRLLTQQQVRLHGEWCGFGHLQNLSRAGAAIMLDDDCSMIKSEHTTLVLLDGTQLAATVVWKFEKSIGLEFDLKFVDASELLHLDHLGRDLFLSVVRYQKLRADCSGRNA